MEASRLENISLEEYRTIEEESGQKYEFHNGTIFAMAGGTYNHGLISGNIFALINAKLLHKNTSCFPLNSDIKLHVQEGNRFLYPDTMVVCNKAEKSRLDGEAITNPIVIIEVLSKSTANYDRGDKFFFYRQIPTLQEYVLVEQEKPLIETFTRSQKNMWSIDRSEGLDASIQLNSIDIDLALSMVYRNVEFEVV
ncbi:MAG: Uma2 family endonuclease [Flammeovirgaceae bacterium]